MPVDHFPKAIRPAAFRVRDFLLTDAAALIILGIAAIARGISYLPSVRNLGNPHPAENWLAMDWWGIVWVAAGALCVGAATKASGRVAAGALGIVVALHTLWAMSFTWATLAEDMGRGWVTAINYWAVAALAVWAVWRGSRVEVSIRDRGC